MTPFTTYIIPESSEKKTDRSLKWLWIVVDQPLLPSHEELLQKICEALKADFTSDVKIIVCPHNESLSLSESGTSEVSMMISFGVTPSSLGIWIDLKEPGMRYLESYCFILSVSLGDLINQPSSKKQLWSSMQSFLHSGLREKKKK